MMLSGAGVVAMGALAAAVGSWGSQVDLRSGLIPWGFGVLVVGVGLIVLGTFRCDVGRPRWLLRWGCSSALVGLGIGAVFLFGTGILSVVGSDLVSTGDTSISALGTLVASVATLLVLPSGCWPSAWRSR
jgi:hypothetical protein